MTGIRKRSKRKVKSEDRDMSKSRNDPDEILRTVQLYLILKSQSEVATRLGMKQSSVSSRLQRVGCPTRPKSRPGISIEDFDEAKWESDVRACIRRLHDQRRESQLTPPVPS